MDMVCEKMVLAVLSGSDSAEVVHALNDHGFYATMLASTGGFLQKKSEAAKTVSLVKSV